MNILAKLHFDSSDKAKLSKRAPLALLRIQSAQLQTSGLLIASINNSVLCIFPKPYWLMEVDGNFVNTTNRKHIANGHDLQR